VLSKLERDLESLTSQKNKVLSKLERDLESLTSQKKEDVLKDTMKLLALPPHSATIGHCTGSNIVEVLLDDDVIQPLLCDPAADGSEKFEESIGDLKGQNIAGYSCIESKLVAGGQKLTLEAEPAQGKQKPKAISYPLSRIGQREGSAST
jgi:hypothetical protein